MAKVPDRFVAYSQQLLEFCDSGRQAVIYAGEAFFGFLRVFSQSAQLLHGGALRGQLCSKPANFFPRPLAVELVDLVQHRLVEPVERFAPDTGLPCDRCRRDRGALLHDLRIAVSQARQCKL